MSLARILIKTQRRAEAGNYERLIKPLAALTGIPDKPKESLLAGPCYSFRIVQNCSVAISTLTRSVNSGLQILRINRQFTLLHL